MNYSLTQDQREILSQELRQLKQKEFALRQALVQEKQNNEAAQEKLFLELLEVFDGLEFLINYLQNNSEIIPTPLKRLPKSIENLQKKLLISLKQREVETINFTEKIPDFSLCQVVDTEERQDVEENTITKVISTGFTSKNRILRPVQVIVAKKAKQV